MVPVWLVATADGKAGGGEILCLGPVSGDALERGAEPNLIDLQRILAETDLSAESELTIPTC